MGDLTVKQQGLPEVQEQQSTTLIQVIEKAAMNPEVDIDKMERLLAMKERIDTKQSEIEFNTALSRVQMSIPAVLKNKSNDQTRSQYADLEQTNRSIIPAYTAEGFSLSFGTGDSSIEGFIRILCDVSHSGGFSKNYHLDLPLDDAGIKGSKNKTSVHATGSSMSYGRRYLTNMIFNLTTSDDNDGNGLGVPEKPIGENEIEALQSLIDEKKVSVQRVFKYYGITELNQLPESKYKEAAKNIMKAANK